tara:strand:+ start:17357 stop:17668 length:312 start_codon:yes stop_codon:yes gene_type:complete
MNKKFKKDMIKLLTESREIGFVFGSKADSLLRRKAINEAEARDWIYDKGERTYKLTSVGVEALINLENPILERIKRWSRKYWWSFIIPILIYILGRYMADSLI